MTGPRDHPLVRGHHTCQPIRSRPCLDDPSAFIDDTQRNRFHHPVAAVTAPGFGRGRRLSQTSWLNASNKLAFQAAAAGGEALLVHADTNGGAVAQATTRTP